MPLGRASSAVPVMTVVWGIALLIPIVAVATMFAVSTVTIFRPDGRARHSQGEAGERVNESFDLHCFPFQESAMLAGRTRNGRTADRTTSDTRRVSALLA